MSVPTLNARTLRVVRWVQVAGLILSAADLARNLLMGYAALAPAVMIVLWLALICAQTKLIRRREELERPRPDYSAIAAMEREVYGETFEHEGAPKPFTYPSAALLPPKGYGVTMAEFGENLARLGRSDSLPSVRPVRMVAGQTKMCKRCMTPYARLDGFCSRCYRTYKQAQRDS